MLSLLDMANHFLGYFNVNTKLKGRIYTILGFLGDWYLLYIGVRFIQNGAHIRGVLLILVFLFLMYCTAVNFFFYFLKRRFPLDPSERIAKVLGDERLKQQEDKLTQRDQLDRFAPATGLYDNKQVIPAKVMVNGAQHKNLATIAAQFSEANLLPQDYEGQSDQEVLAATKDRNQPVFAIGKGVPLPFAILKSEAGHLLVYAGLNQMTALPVGRITRVGQNWGAGLVSLGALAGMFTMMLAMIYSSSRLVYAIGRDGLLPRQLGRVNAQTGTPTISLVTVTTIIALMGGLIPLDQLTNLVNIGTLITFTFVSFGVIPLRRRQDINHDRGFKVPWYPVLPIISGLTCLLLLGQLPRETWVASAIWFTLGIVLYFTYGMRHSRN